MARIRTIKPEFFTSLTVANLPIEARLTFIGLWTHADDEGRCVDDPRLIKAAIWPLDDRLSTDVEGDLRILTESSLILRYKAGDRSFLAVRGWREHQRINRPTKSKLPPPPDGPPPTWTTAESVYADPPSPAETPGQAAAAPAETPNSVSPHAQLTEDSPQERNREQGTGNRESTPPPASRSDVDAPIAGEIVDNPLLPALRVVPDIAVAEPAVEKAGHIVKAWIDHCTASGVILPPTTIKKYAAKIGEAHRAGIPVDTIKRALGQMLGDNEAARPSLLDNYVVRAQTGAPRPPRRMTPGEASALQHSTDGTSSVGALIHDALTRPA